MLDPTIYKDWQIAEEAEKTLPPVEQRVHHHFEAYWRE